MSRTNKIQESLMTDTRYPYTYACDLIRRGSPIRKGEGVVLSRGDASRIIKLVSDAIGMDNHELACKLAEAQLAHQADPDQVEKETQRLMVALFGTNTPSFSRSNEH